MKARLAKYGLNIARYRHLYASQGGRCAICEVDISLGIEPDQAPLKTHIDHCHTYGIVRGLLCPNCNTGLGHFMDNPKWLRKAAEYVEGHAPNTSIGSDLVAATC